MPIRARFKKKQHWGHWEENKTRWYEQKLVYCESCGVLIPTRQWVAERGGTRHIFCGVDCARLYRNASGLVKTGKMSSHKAGAADR